MSSISSTSLRTLSAYRLKPIPGSHAGTYFTEKGGALSFKAEGRIERQSQTTHGVGKGPRVERLGYRIEQFLTPRFQTIGRIYRPSS